jgi:hypothetical protein
MNTTYWLAIVSSYIPRLTITVVTGLFNPDMTIHIRDATADDLPAIARIASAAFHPATDAIAARLFPTQLQEQDSTRDNDIYSWRYAKKTASLSSPDAVMVVAIDDALPLSDQVVGFGLWDVYEDKPKPAHNTYTQTDSEKAANQPRSTVQEVPPPSFDQEAYAELRAIVSADHQEMFGERGIKDVWRKFSSAALLSPCLPSHKASATTWPPSPLSETAKIGN